MQYNTGDMEHFGLLVRMLRIWIIEHEKFRGNHWIQRYVENGCYNGVYAKYLKQSKYNTITRCRAITGKTA